MTEWPVHMLFFIEVKLKDRNFLLLLMRISRNRIK